MSNEQLKGNEKYVHFLKQLHFLRGSRSKTTLNPFTPKISFSNSPSCMPYNSHDQSSEKLVLDQLLIPKLIFIFILNANLLDIVMIL